jgi:type I restriction enzyme S subunit
MNGFQTKRLIELCTKIGSGATPRGGKETYLKHGNIFLIRSQNVLDFSFSLDGGA